jgi:hypothetical protein
MAKSTTPDEASEAVYTIRIERAKLARLHEIAESEHRTLAGKIRVLFEREIAAHGERKAA